MRRLALSILLVAGCADPACDGAALQAALDEAAPGDLVLVGACTVVADLEVPAGVTLRGASRATSIVEAASSVAVRVTTAAGTRARVEGLTLRSDACAALAATGDGALDVEDASVEASRGIGLGAEGLAELSLVDVDVVGPVMPGVLPSAVPLPPYRCDTADPATHGIVVVSVADASLTRTTSRGFAAFGALFVDSTTTWSEGSSSDHVGTGLEVFGGRAELFDLEVSRARQGTAPIESFNAIFAGGANVSTARLDAAEGDVFGVFHDDAVAVHQDLRAAGNGFAGVWSQSSPALSLSGAATSITGNRFAGVAAFGVGTVSVADATVEGTTEGIAAGPAGAIRGADGVHLVDSPSASLERLALLDNGRVGLLVDLNGASTDTLTLDTVRVRGSGIQLGARAQNGTVNPGWDAPVRREGATAGNDAMFTGVLDIAGVIGPSCLPATSDVATVGLSSLVP